MERIEQYPMRGLAPEEIPHSTDEIDVDRVVWDPAYRGAVKAMLKRETSGHLTSELPN